MANGSHCQKCGKNLALVGNRHNCIPVLANTMANSPLDVANTDADMANEIKGCYRYRDPEKRKAYMRELMRKRRACLKK